LFAPIAPVTTLRAWLQWREIRYDGAMAIPLIIDTDPGTDDAIAILLAFASPELEVLGLTTVAGNVGQPAVTDNALRICDLAGRPDVPVLIGAAAPLSRPLRSATGIHGIDGLGGLDLPPPSRAPACVDAIEYIVETVRYRDGVVLAPIGPLTNIALALRRAPDIARRIARIELMGGGIATGNVTRAAEFNIHADPEAAAIVFGSGAAITMYGLDVTHKAILGPGDAVALRATRTAAADIAARLIDRPHLFRPERYGRPGVPVHDACVVAGLIQPGLFDARSGRVDIVTDDGDQLGRTRAVFESSAPNSRIVENVDRDGFAALLIERLGATPRWPARG
jgi:purine nucleosidase